MVTPVKSRALVQSVDGILLVDDNGTEIAWNCAGDIVPNTGGGLAAPIGSTYVRNNGDIWKKTTAPATGWQLSGLGDPVATLIYAAGRGGTTSSGTWLLYNGTPTDAVGIPNVLTDGKIKAVSVANENTATFGVEVYEHDGLLVNSTLLTTINVSSAKTGVSTGLDISMTSGKQIAFKTITGSTKNINCYVVAKGTTI